MDASGLRHRGEAGSRTLVRMRPDLRVSHPSKPILPLGPESCVWSQRTARLPSSSPSILVGPCWPSRTRTCNFRINNPALCQLSYRPPAGPVGIEPTPSGFGDRTHFQLCYVPDEQTISRSAIGLGFAEVTLANVHSTRRPAYLAYRRRDSNPQAFRRLILSQLSFPVSPLRRCCTL